MNDFSFYNKAYDLLLDLKEKDIIKPNISFNSVQEVRLMIDLAKTMYPIYANADDRTMGDFVKDLFNIDPKPWELAQANHEQNEYKPVKITDIHPNRTYKLLGKCTDDTEFYYHYTFPTKDISLLEYNRIFMKIWENKESTTKPIFKYKIGDKVTHINDNDAKGKIKQRLASFLKGNEIISNQYAITWENTGTNPEVPLNYWFGEEALILINQIKKLEALPMKTIEVTNRRKGSPHIKTINRLLDIDGEIEHTKITTTFTGTNRKSAEVRKKLKEKRKARKARQRLKKIQSTPRPVIYKERTKDELDPNKVVTTNHKLVCVKHTLTGVVTRMRHNEAKRLIGNKDNYDYATKLEWRKYLNVVAKNRKGKNPPKYTKVGGTEGIGNSTIIEGVIRRNRRYNKSVKASRLVKEQFVPVVIPEEKVKIKGLNPTTWFYDLDGNFVGSDYFVSEFIRPAKVILKRILTRVKPSKLSILTKEEKLERSSIDKINYCNKKGNTPLPDLISEFSSDERRNEKHSSVESWSQKFMACVDVIKHGGASLQIHEMLDNKSHFGQSILWTTDKIDRFIKYLRLTTHGVFGEKIKISRPTGKKPIKLGKTGKPIKTSYYKKSTKIKKSKQPVEIEVLKTATKIDYSKLKHNLPEENKVVYVKLNDNTERIGQYKDINIYSPTGELLCPIRDVISWKYKPDIEYQNTIIDEGGGITQVPVKSRRKDPEHLKAYFTRMKKHKERKKLKNEKTRKNTNVS